MTEAGTQIYIISTFTFTLCLGVSPYALNCSEAGVWINGYFIAYSVVYTISTLFANTCTCYCPPADGFLLQCSLVICFKIEHNYCIFPLSSIQLVSHRLTYL